MASSGASGKQLDSFYFLNESFAKTLATLFLQ